MEDKAITILAIESSCDETAAAVVKDGRLVMSNIISSQIDIHTLYGGVVPEIASRKHIERINRVIEQALKEAGVTLHDIDAIAVTYGPGLVGALLVGVAEAKAISFATGIPLIGVHHIEGHICAAYIEHEDLKPPFISLVVSGGHTHLVRVRDHGEYEILGRTRDDAAGEAFDKVARAIGLGYPGGPKIDRVAKEGNAGAIEFPRPKLRPLAGDQNSPGSGYDFSFSGLKSAVLNYLNSEKMAGRDIVVADVAASFQKAVTDVLTEHAMNAVKEFDCDVLSLAGGVASNSALRASVKEACDAAGVKLYCPSPVFCTDNAAMIGVAGYYEYIKGNFADLSLNAVPDLKLGQR
ncbi:MAG: tRNA (adenosine(37)-N6)-threonylcarbamoyltransferase complex transferase subunit TsaD [Lachnospiraceae bacterium]|nr:tRNA (adenosine(37)-N6)-threonylcarbamoyltransferase complex transferase subunit TsaD [Lachnospiraceae bacterium]